MSEPVKPRMKISREGVLLIKSFEGFRPRAHQGQDGRWVVGYGHTASAREGATVSETDAELLLQYDLIPVQSALSGGLTRAINQHQYDALASFAFSVGTEAFAASDVLARVNAGDETDAAEALVAWPEPPVRDAGLRRRTAERALFTADPASAVTLFDLLAAPLTGPAAPAISRPAAEEVGPRVPTDGPTPAEPEDETSADQPAKPGVQAHAAVETPIFAPVSIPGDAATPMGPVTVQSVTAGALTTGTLSSEALIASDVASDAEVIAVPSPADQSVESFSPPAVVAETVTTERDDAYARPRTGPIDRVLPNVATDPFAHVPDTGVETAADPFTGAVAPSSPILWPALDETPAQDAISGDLQVSGAIAEGAALASPRLVWPNEAADQNAAAPRFDDQGRLDLSSDTAVWPDPSDAGTAGFSWRRVWAYLVMGGFGLVSLAMSMAALRKASIASTDVRSILAIAAVLAIIGAACVGVSAYNIYQRLSDDR